MAARSSSSLLLCSAARSFSRAAAARSSEVSVPRACASSGSARPAVSLRSMAQRRSSIWASQVEDFLRHASFSSSRQAMRCFSSWSVRFASRNGAVRSRWSARPRSRDRSRSPRSLPAMALFMAFCASSFSSMLAKTALARLSSEPARPTCSPRASAAARTSASPLSRAACRIFARATMRASSALSSRRVSASTASERPTSWPSRTAAYQRSTLRARSASLMRARAAALRSMSRARRPCSSSSR
mmetsp:Transcript_49452/g.143402  ORF Transcript_49452/g.143402 Transcript_49452/m.143402 type:complete len:244 (+) Transcript_49452:436-1167(+)